MRTLTPDVVRKVLGQVCGSEPGGNVQGAERPFVWVLLSSQDILLGPARPPPRIRRRLQAVAEPANLGISLPLPGVAESSLQTKAAF